MRAAVAVVLVAGALAAAACQRPEPSGDAPASEPAPPEAERSICERPVRVAAPAGASEASFQAFAETWLEKKRTGAPPGVRREIGGEFETELRATGNAQAPYVGTLRYCEHELRCTEAAPASCTPTKRNAITEIFRFEAGKWQY